MREPVIVGRPQAGVIKTTRGSAGTVDEVYPNLAEQWHPTRNAPLLPEDVMAGSDESVWWKCPECGGEWAARVSVRSKRNGYTCPICYAKANRSRIEGRSVADLDPNLAAEWHPDLNGDLGPQDVTPGSGRMVWWKCPKCGGVWDAVVRARCKHGEGCPHCRNIRRGTVSVAEAKPSLADEWDYGRNGALTPYNCAAGSSKVVWWKCGSCGEPYLAEVRYKVKAKNYKCPHCQLKADKKRRQQRSRRRARLKAEKAARAAGASLPTTN